MARLLDDKGVSPFYVTMKKDIFDSLQGNPELMSFGLFQAAQRRLGKNATKEEVLEYMKSCSEEEKKEISMDAVRLLMELLGSVSGDDSDEDTDADYYTDDDDDSDPGYFAADDDFGSGDIYEGSGRLECMPVVGLKKYTLRIKLNGISPSIWRKIEVPSSVKLTSLAEIVLDAMGWWNEHLHQFVTKGRKEFYRTADKKDDSLGRSYWGGDYSISHLLKNEKDTVLFEYDYGDGWEHTVTLSKVEDYADGEKPVVRLIGGKRACPPEDCGGIYGYNELCESLKHPYSAHAKEMKQWLGYTYDPEDFDFVDVQETIDNYNFD